MSDAQLELVAKGRTLTVAERLAVIRELASSLEGEDSFWLSDEWAATLDRRASELDADRSLAVPWEDVDRRLDARIRRHVEG
jgi:putative addiction module component (TIGR02574 family)